ncbi:MAG: cobalamin-independent methionine synthase II family protein [Acidiferrobacterales bacterium]|nr:cobalamin-independent methionine synthase II family protein [Acidiferrobacterales bacterium]
MLTTCIGAYPKPSFLELPDWFSNPTGMDMENPTKSWAGAIAAMGDSAEQNITNACREVVTDQVEAGIDIPTDGEVCRENYIHYHCRHLEGFDFNQLTERELRGGTYRAQLPTISGPVRARDVGFLVRDWKRAQSFTNRPVKITMPGPLTVTDSNANTYYESEKPLGAAIADALNTEALALVDAGCVNIQVDEPVFARKPDVALDYGIENLERVFHGVPASVNKVMHMCCGYPDRMDRLDYPKADRNAYFRIMGAVDDSCVDMVSIEDAHRHNDLSLLELAGKTKVILGVVAIALSRVETVGQIVTRLEQALQHIDPDRLVAAPDCGLGLLGRHLSVVKLRNMCEAAAKLSSSAHAL